MSAEESATLRDQLIVDLDRLQSSDEAADWVHKNFAIKNTMMAADADSVEASFRERVLTLEAGVAVAEGQSDHGKDDGVVPPDGQAFIETMDASAAASIILPQRPVGHRRSRGRKNDPASRQGALSDISLPSRASYAAGRQAKHTTSASPSRVHSAARSRRPRKHFQAPPVAGAAWTRSRPS